MHSPTSANNLYMMHYKTYNAWHAYGNQYFKDILMAESPISIYNMIETIREVRDSKETSLSS